MIGAMFGILGVSLFLLGLQVVRLSVLQGLDLQVVGKIKCKVRWLMAVTITAFAIKMVSFLISPISGYGFGGDLCNAMYPWFFYPVPEALPVSRVPPLTSALLEMRTPPLPPNTPPTLTRGAHHQALLILALMSPDGIWHNHLRKIVVCRRTRVGGAKRESALSEDADASDYLPL